MRQIQKDKQTILLSVQVFAMNLCFWIFISSWGWSSCNHLQPAWRRSKWHLPRRITFPHSMVPISNHLWHSFTATKNLIAKRFQRFANGKHFVACAITARCTQFTNHVPSIGLGLWWKGVAIHLQWSIEKCCCQIQCITANYTTSTGKKQWRNFIHKNKIISHIHTFCHSFISGVVVDSSGASWTGSRF